MWLVRVIQRQRMKGEDVEIRRGHIRKTPQTTVRTFTVMLIELGNHRRALSRKVTLEDSYFIFFIQQEVLFCIGSSTIARYEIPTLCCNKIPLAAV